MEHQSDTGTNDPSQGHQKNIQPASALPRVTTLKVRRWNNRYCFVLDHRIGDEHFVIRYLDETRKEAERTLGRLTCRHPFTWPDVRLCLQRMNEGQKRRASELAQMRGI
ncbi:MAG: hypothetical protein AAB489_03605 [Patescibacteria group bacterium]